MTHPSKSGRAREEKQNDNELTQQAQNMATNQAGISDAEDPTDARSATGSQSYPREKMAAKVERDLATNRTPKSDQEDPNDALTATSSDVYTSEGLESNPAGRDIATNQASTSDDEDPTNAQPFTSSESLPVDLL